MWTRLILWWKLRKFRKTVENEIVTAILKQPGIPLNSTIRKRLIREALKRMINESLEQK